MKEELYNHTRRYFYTDEYSDTNDIDYFKKKSLENVLSKETISSYLPYQGIFTHKNSYNTEEKITEHYGNLMASVRMVRRIICVVKEGDKITFKMFFYNRRRLVGKKWFKTNTHCKFFTFNHKTNALYTGSLDNYHLKKKNGCL
jgi:hypothetical protein